MFGVKGILKRWSPVKSSFTVILILLHTAWKCICSLNQILI